MLINIYIFILSLTVIFLGMGAHTVMNKENRLAPMICRMQLFAMTAILANIVFVASKNITISNIGFSVFSAMIDWILLAMYVFTAEYVMAGDRDTLVFKIFTGLSVLDSITLLLNVFFNHVFCLKSRIYFSKYEIFEAAEFTWVYHIHLVICYLLAARIFVLLIIKAYHSSLFYRSKYVVIIGLFSALLLVDGLCVLFHVPLNVSILFYGFLSLAISYYTLSYQPRQLIDNILKMIMKNIRSGIVCFDENQNCIFANDVVWDMFKIEKDVSILEGFTYEGQKAKFSSDEPYSKWQEQRVIGGEMRYFEFERQNIYDRKGKYVGSYFNMRDRTEQHIFHEKEVNMEKSANRAKSDFLSRMSHDIRTPINSISGMNEMILRDNKDETIQEYAGNIKEAVDVLMGLINDVLDFSKIEAGKMTFVDREYNTAEILDSVINIIRTQAEKKKIEFKHEISEGLPSVLMGDDVKLVQILVNILSNAVKYTKEGSVTLKVSGKKDENGEFLLCVSVTDTGIGIKKEDIPKLFSAFERIEEVKNHSIQGTGLGLNITSYFLKMMGSALNVESEYGKGSIFSFELKQKVADETPAVPGKAAAKSSKAYKTTFKKPGARILVVDDNKVNRKVFMGLLRETMIDIDQAESGQQCLGLVAQNRYDLIFLDHMMPEMDGIETFEKMKTLENSKCTDTPVVMLTANALEGAEQEYLEKGFNDFLTKPVKSQVLEEIVKKYLG